MRRKFVLQLPSHHQFNQGLAAKLGSSLGADVLSIPENHDSVRNLVHFLQPMTDVYDAQPLAPQFADDFEEAIHFLGRERRARLIHHQKPRILRKGLGDLHDLLLRDCHVPTALFRIDHRAEALKELKGAAPLLPRIDESRLHLLLPQKDILPRAQVGHQVELLVNNPYSRLLARVGRGKFGRAPVDQDSSPGGRMRSPEDFDESAFARPILSQQRKNLARLQREIHSTKGPNPGK